VFSRWPVLRVPVPHDVHGTLQGRHRHSVPALRRRRPAHATVAATAGQA
jgi:hypothetical protein